MIREIELESLRQARLKMTPEQRRRQEEIASPMELDEICIETDMEETAEEQSPMSTAQRFEMLKLLLTGQDVSDLPGHENDAALLEITRGEVEKMVLSISVLLCEKTDSAAPPTVSEAYQHLIGSSFKEFAEWMNAAGAAVLLKHQKGVQNAQSQKVDLLLMRALVMTFLLDTGREPWVETPVPHGLLGTKKTDILKLPPSFKEGGFEPLQMHFSSFSKMIEAHEDPGMPPSLHEVMNVQGWTAFGQENGFFPKLLTLKEGEEIFKHAAKGKYSIDWIQFESAAWKLIAKTTVTLGGDIRSLPTKPRNILALLQNHGDDVNPNWTPVADKAMQDAPIVTRTSKISNQLKIVFRRAAAADSPSGITFDQQANRSKSLSLKALARLTASLGFFSSKAMTLSALEAMFHTTRTQVLSEHKREQDVKSHRTGEEPEDVPGYEKCDRGHIPYKVFEAICQELVAVAVSRLGEDSMPFGIKCLESFVTGKAPTTQLKQSASSGMSGEEEQTMAEMRLLMQSRCDMASMSPMTSPLVSPTVMRMCSQSAGRSEPPWSPESTQELIYSPNMPRKQREWILLSAKRKQEKNVGEFPKSEEANVSKKNHDSIRTTSTPPASEKRLLGTPAKSLEHETKIVTVNVFNKKPQHVQAILAAETGNKGDVCQSSAYATVWDCESDTESSASSLSQSARRMSMIPSKVASERTIVSTPMSRASIPVDLTREIVRYEDVEPSIPPNFYKYHRQPAAKKLAERLWTMVPGTPDWQSKKKKVNICHLT